MRVLGLVLLGMSTNLWAVEAPKMVQITYAEKADVQTHRIIGKIQPYALTPLGFRIGGWVDERRVELGDGVQKGAVLAVLDATDARLSVKVAQAELAQAKANAEYASKEWTRLNNLSKQKMVSEQVLQQALAQAKSTQQAVLKAQAALQLAERQLSYTQLRAPSAGRIVSVAVESGQQIEAGKTMLTLAAGALETRVTLTPVQYQQTPTQARVIGVDQPFQCQALLQRKNPLNEPSSLQYEAYYRVQECSQEPPMGSVVRLQWSGSDENLQRIPLSSVVHHAQPAVWLVKDGQVKSHTINVVRMDAQFAYIQPIFTETQAIVAQGAHVLVEGQPVEVIQP